MKKILLVLSLIFSSSFLFSQVTCIAPGALSANSIIATSADIMWVDSNAATEWQIEYDTTGFAQGTGNISVVNNDTTPITGLSATTSYEFYVRAICAPGDTSAWTGPLSFVTPCVAVMAPYTESFDNSSTPNCWIESGDNSWDYSTAADYGASSVPDHTGNSGNYAWMDGSDNGSGEISSLTTLPIDVSTLTNPMLGYWIFSNNTNDAALNKTIVEFYDGSNWHQIDSIQENLGTNWVERTINLTTYNITGPIKVRYTVTGSSVGSAFYNDILIDDFSIYEAPLNNVRLVEVIASDTLCAGPENISLVLANKGGNAVDSVEIFFSANSYEDTLSYNSTINIEDVDTVSLGSFSFVADSVYNITFYTFDPNGTTDGVPADDTLRFSGVRTGLNGTYTIDASLPTQGTNFNTITEFSDSLESLGMCGTVVVNLTPGVHSGQLNIIDNTYPVIINGTDTSLATLTHDGSIRNATVFLQNANDVTIVNTTIEATGGSDSWGIQLYENVNDVVISGNRFKMSVASTSDKALINISGSETSNTTMASNVNNIIITGNSFYGGNTGINVYGGSDQNEKLRNIQITGNDISMQEDYGMYVFYTDSILIAGNVVYDLQGSTADGIFLSDLENFTITSNKSIGVDNAIDLNDANYDYAVSSNSLISNNMFIGGDDGMNLNDVGFINIYHNSMYAEDYGMYLNDPDSLDIRNNIFFSNSSYAFYGLDSTYMIMDYNAYYTNGTGDLIRFGGTSDVYADLAAFQTAVPSLNTSSVQGDPLFYSSTDLHASGPVVSDVGDNSVGITTDIDGDTRPLAPSTTVDIGADEFVLASCIPTSSLNAFAITGNTADLTWFENGTATEWEIEYGLSGFTQGNGSTMIVNSDTVTVSGLTVASEHEFYVRAVCTPGDTSRWSGPYTFITGCGIFTAPFFETFTGSSIPNCWNQSSVSGGPWEFGGSTNPDFGRNYEMPDHTNGNDNEYTWMDFSGTDEAVVLETPEIDVSALTVPVLDFWMVSHNNTSSVSVYNKLYVEAWDGSSYLIVDSIQGDLGLKWNNFIYDISPYIYSTNLVKLRFRAESGGDGNDYDNDLLIDDVSVVEAPSCWKPTNLSASNITPTSADLGWVENNSATNWEIEYGISGFTRGTGTNSVVNSNPTNVTGLNPISSYEFYVRSICATADSSEWVGPFAFVTPCPIYTAPYSENFDSAAATSAFSGVDCWRATGPGAGDVDLVTSPDGSSISSIPSAPNAVEFNDGTFNSDTSLLVSPQFSDLGTGMNRIRFQAAFESTSAGEGIYVGVMSDPDVASTFVPIDTIDATDIGGNYGFSEVIINLTNTALIGTNEHIAFAHGDGSGNYEAYIDNFVYEPIPANNIGVSAIVSPSTGCGLSASDSVVVTVTNFGTASQNNFDLVYTLNGVAITPETYTGTINPFASATYTFSIPVNVSTVGDYTITAYTIHTGDTIQTNDTAHTVITSMATVNALPYTESFETGPANWFVEGINTSWELGAPANTIIDTASDGTEAWVTDLDADHGNGETGFVNSPCFDFTGVSDPYIEMDIWYDIEGTWDGAILQASTDGGSTWSRVGSLGDPNNWYPDTSAAIVDNGLETHGDAWTGDGTSGTQGWVTAEHALDGLGNMPSVRLRVAFASDGATTEEGMAFDNVTVYNAGCAGIPDQTIASAPDSLCSNVGFDLLANGLSEALGLTYQWEESVAGSGIWTAISGATDSSHTISGGITTDMEYRFISNCTNSGLSDTSNIITVQVSHRNACYCEVDFLNTTLPITLVDFAGINNVSSATPNGSPDLEDFSSQVGMVNTGKFYQITVEGNTDGNYTDEYQVYFDWNQDGDLDDMNESYYIGSITNSTGTDNIQASGNIAVPSNALAGNTRMRVVKNFSTVGSACVTDQYGQAEDYTVNVTISLATYHSIGELNSIDANGVGDSLNVYAWTSGTVAGVDLDGTSGLSFTVVEQSTANPEGIHVASSTSVSNYAVTEGDSVMLRGTVNQNNGLLTLDVDSIQVIQPNSSLPAHSLITVLDETTESQLVRIENMEVASVGTGTDFEVVLTDGTDTLSMWVDSDTDVDNISFSPGQSICTLFGIGSQDDPTSPYLQNYRVVPMSANDVLFNPMVNLGLDTIVCDTVNYTLDAGAGFASYSWNIGDTTQTIAPTDANDSLYIVTVTNTNGCSATDTIIVEVDICTGIQSSDISNSFSVSPNPSNGKFNVSAEGLDNGKGSILIRDISGKIIYNEKVNVASGRLKIDIDIHEFAKGIYFMSYRSAKESISRKIVVQ